MKKPLNWLRMQWREVSIDRKIELFFIIAGVLVAAAVMKTGGAQLEQMNEQTRAMQEQLTEIKASGEETKKAIAALEIIANSTRLTIEHSKASLEASIEATRLDQRAWVGAKHYRMKTFEPGRSIAAEVVFTNTGKTPAHKFKVTALITRVDKPLTDSDMTALENQYRTSSNHADVVFPGAEKTVTIPMSDIASEQIIGLVKTKKLVVYAFGTLKYSDVFGKSHFTKFCGKYAPDKGNLFNACHEHNEAQ